MPMRGLKNVKRVAKQMEESRASWGTYIPFFDLKDGETAEMRFNGTVDEPYVGDVHNIKQGKNFSSIECAKGHKDHAGCVGCYCVEQGDKRVGRPTPRATFNVIDRRFFHKLKDKERSTDEREKFKYILCSEDAHCKLCRRRVERVRGGQKRWTLAITWANALATINDKLQKKCRSCGTGKIKVIGFQDLEGEPVDPDAYSEEELVEAIETGDVEEVLECTKCDNPERASLFDAVLEASRTGSGTTTSYQFEVINMDDMEDWELECEPADLTKLMRPRSAEKQAEKLGVRNPFDGEGDADDYDEGEEEEDDDIFPGDEDADDEDED